jgi:hypothetical protein
LIPSGAIRDTILVIHFVRVKVRATGSPSEDPPRHPDRPNAQKLRDDNRAASHESTPPLIIARSTDQPFRTARAMNSYPGFVAYLDLLGIGALTRGKVLLTEEDFSAFQIRRMEPRQHLFAANLLACFRRTLMDAQAEFDRVSFAQLSDAAFLWSASPIDLLPACRRVMYDLAHAGVLCRGGIGFGEIVEPDKVNADLGAFVLGPAVTRAVGAERSGKGFRVFVDSLVRPALMDAADHATRTAASLLASSIVTLTNPLDATRIDEYQWYLFAGDSRAGRRDGPPRHEQLRILMALMALLLHSPKFRWNVASEDGRRQVNASLETILRCMRREFPDASWSEAAPQIGVEATERSEAALHRAIQEWESR